MPAPHRQLCRLEPGEVTGELGGDPRQVLVEIVVGPVRDGGLPGREVVAEPREERGAGMAGVAVEVLPCAECGDGDVEELALQVVEGVRGALLSVLK
ncbi:hypothetical protein ACWGJ9_11870 [Curtobacterium citreum]